MLDSPFVRDVKKNWDKILGVAIIVAWTVLCWVVWDRHTATIFVWGAVWGGIVFLILSARESKEMVYRNALREYAQLNHPVGDQARKVLEEE